MEAEQRSSLHQPTGEPVAVYTEQPVLPRALLHYCTSVSSVQCTMSQVCYVDKSYVKTELFSFINVDDFLKND